MRPLEGQPSPSHEGFKAKARKAVGFFRLRSSPQLATATEGIGNLSNPLDTADPKLTNMLQLRLRPAHAPAGAGTAGTAARRDGETKQARERRPLGRGARIALAGVLAYTAAGAINEQFNDMPLSIKSVVVNDAIWPWHLGNSAVEGIQGLLNGEEAASTFNNEAGKTRFGENNTVKITPREAEEKKLLEPKITVDDKGTVIVTTLLPGLFPSDIPDTQISSETVAKKGEAPFERANFPMPSDFKLTIPKGTYYALLKPSKGEPGNPDLVDIVVSFYYYPEKDITLKIYYESTGLIPVNEQDALDGETYKRLYNPSMGKDFSKLNVSDGITPIAKPASPNQILSISVYAKSGSIDKPYSSVAESIASHKSVIWKNFVDQNQKLEILSDGAVNYGNGVIGPTPAEAQRANSGK